MRGAIKGSSLSRFQGKFQTLTDYATPLITSLRQIARSHSINQNSQNRDAYVPRGHFHRVCPIQKCHVVSYRGGGCSPPRILLIGDTLNAARLFLLFLSSWSCSFRQRLRRITTAATTATAANHHPCRIAAIRRSRHRSDRAIHGDR